MSSSGEESPDVARVIEGMKKQRQKLDQTSVSQRPSKVRPSKVPAAQSPSLPGPSNIPGSPNHPGSDTPQSSTESDEEDGNVSDATKFDDSSTPSPPLRFTGLSQHPNQLVRPQSNRPAVATTTRPSPSIKVEEEDVNDPSQFPSPPRSPTPPIKKDPKNEPDSDEDGPTGPETFPTSNLRGA